MINVNNLTCHSDASRRTSWWGRIVFAVIPLFTLALFGFAVGLGLHEYIGHYYGNFCVKFIMSICMFSPFLGTLVAFYALVFIEYSPAFIWKTIIGALLLFNGLGVMFFLQGFIRYGF